MVEAMTPPARPDAATWAKELVEAWLRDWDGKGLGNFVVEDECMVDLAWRLTSFHAQLRAEIDHLTETLRQERLRDE
jgi:hypothetical protein